MNVQETIGSIVQGAKSAPEDDRTHEVLKGIRALPGIEELNGPLIFRTGGHQIQVGLTAALDKTSESLREIAHLKLGIAPEVVSQQEFAPGESVLVTRYAGAEKLQALKPSDAPIAENVRAKARAELEKLAIAGKQHGFAARGFAQWLTTPDKKALMLDGWSALKSATPAESAEQLAGVDALLARLA